MNLLALFTDIVHYIDLPFTLLFLCIGIALTIYTRVPQFYAWRHFMQILTSGLKRRTTKDLKTINAFHALCAAMATSIGIGNIIGPSLAITIGGPGALFWLLVYAFFGAATKLTEVCFAVHFRTKNKDGRILGGPAQYLSEVHPLLATWYGAATIILFAGWSGIQSKALAEILAKQQVPELVTGILLAIFVVFVLIGGAQRVGAIASKLVPFMFGLYVLCALFILSLQPALILKALQLIGQCIACPAAPIGGFLGATIFGAIRQGTYKGVFITESGMGTSSIAHAMTDAQRPIDQGVLALYSVTADAFLCLLSGLLVLTSQAWTTGAVSNILVFTVFQEKLPVIGPFVFIVSATLFITTTAIGNGFNGGQSFAAFTKYRWIRWYYVFVGLVIVVSSIIDVPLLWAIMDAIFPFVALPNLIGICILAYRYRNVLKY